MQAGHSSTLQECAAEGDLDGVKRLVNLAEDVDCIDEDGNTALHYAAEGGFEAIVTFLVEKAARLDAVNDEGDTALHKATVNNFVEVIKLLIAGHANVNAQVCFTLLLVTAAVLVLIQLELGWHRSPWICFSRHAGLGEKT